MPSWMQGWPVVAVVAFFLFGAVARSQALYWAGRGVSRGVGRTRFGDRFDGLRVRRAVAAIERWGMPVVPLAFLTVGFQSAVLGAAGLLRIGWLRFTLWALPGCVAWAIVWGGGGMATVAAAWALARRSPWGLAGLVAITAFGVTTLLLRARRRREEREAVTALAEARADHTPGP